MNRRQKQILFTASALIAALVFFPPFRFVVQTIEFNLGYGFLLRPPMHSGYVGNVNTNSLVTEIMAVTVLAGLLAFAFKDKK
jgi:hypothetical protein